MKLRNCPFCGSEPELDWDGKHWTIKCYCGVSNGHTITKEAAIKAWNTRTDKPDPHELWAAAQLMPGEGIEDGVRRIVDLLKTTHQPEEE